MDSNILKQLKDAGFPIKPFLKDILKHSTEEDIRNLKIGHVIKCGTSLENKIPTLSDLIEACGIKFDSLHQNFLKGWTVKEDTFGKRPMFYGKTPEEAVANLWLKLNDK